jgi:hypothetical protein
MSYTRGAIKELPMRRVETKLVLASLILFFLILLNDSVSFGKEMKRENLTSCLRAKNVKVYGRADCGFCQKQKQMFSGIGENLEASGLYVECTGNSACRSVYAYPTWVIEGRRYPGLLKIDILKRISGC